MYSIYSDYKTANNYLLAINSLFIDSSFIQNIWIWLCRLPRTLYDRVTFFAKSIIIKRTVNSLFITHTNSDHMWTSLTCSLVAECSWCDGADTTRTTWSRRSARRPTANQSRSWVPRRKRSGSSKRSDPSRQQPVESPALFSVTRSSGRTNKDPSSLQEDV